MQTKTVTPSVSTQYITPSTRYDGLNQVVVNGDSDLISSNIKSGINIFGVTGTYSSQLNTETIDLQPNYYISDNTIYVDFPSSIETNKIFSMFLSGYFETDDANVSVERDFAVVYSKTTSTNYRFKGQMTTGLRTKNGSSVNTVYSFFQEQYIDIKISSPNTVSTKISTSYAAMATVSKREGLWYGGDLVIYYYS